MLQTCTRCRNRRIKCDSLLPACANCARNDVECTFRDDALGEDIPRSYVKALNDQIQELSSQLAIDSITPCSNTRSTAVNDPTKNLNFDPLYVLMPGPGNDVYLDVSLPPRITRVTFEVLSLSDAMVDIPAIDDGDSVPPDLSQIDRSLLTPRAIRFLLGRYDRCIRPQYSVVRLDHLSHDGMNLQKLPDAQKFKIIMACAIAAAHESYKAPNWKPVAHVCREWANELITPIILAADVDSLAAILLLAIYELADPNRGAIWELLDLALRTCLQQGWHRSNGNDDQTILSLEDDGIPEVRARDDTEFHLLLILREIEGSLRTILNRPTIMSGSRWPTVSRNETVFLCYEQLSHAIYGNGKVYDMQDCPFVGRVATLMELIETLPVDHPVTREMWLLFLPVCVKHKQCVFCFQEADDTFGKGMRTLRRKILESASHLISAVHQVATGKDGFIPPFLASTRALIAGCSIATSISKKWTNYQSHAKDLHRCTEILSLFAPHWKGGHGYIQVWRTIVDFLHIESN